MRGKPKESVKTTAKPALKQKRKVAKSLDERKLRYHPEIPALVADLIKDYGTQGTKDILRSIRTHTISISFKK